MAFLRSIIKTMNEDISTFEEGTVKNAGVACGGPCKH